MSLAIACVGHASVDHHFEIERFAAHPTKTPARSYEMIVGGMAANAAIAAQRLGASVRLLGRIGDDVTGQFIRSELLRQSVDMRLEVVPNAASSVSSVVVDCSGERQIFNHRGDALHKAHGLDTAQLEGVAAVLVDPRWCAGAQTALRWARAQGRLSMLDADVAPQADLHNLVALADWAVFSSDGLTAFAPDHTMQEALQMALSLGAKHAMVTCGAKGVHWLHAGRLEHEPAFSVDAIDTTGAGDVFHAALLMALTSGNQEPDSLRHAIRFACAAAALKCQRPSGVMGTPAYLEVLAFLEAHQPA